MNKFEAFEKLKAYSKDLSSVSYDEIYDLLKYGIQKIPMPLSKIKETAFLDRVRRNDGTKLFRHIDELGYIKDEDIVKKYLTEFGRANRPHQVMFYGALETELIDKPRLTAIAETSDIFRNGGSDCISGDIFTLSRWQAHSEFTAVEVVFSEHALATNPEIQRSYAKQLAFLNEKGLPEEEVKFYLEFLKFISSEFSKPVVNHHDYKISAAYANLALEHPDVEGITYPSVQTEYFGINMVMPPSAVDKYFDPTVCSTQVVYRKGQKSLIANGAHYCDNIDPTTEISWKETDPSLLTPLEEAQRYIS